MEMVSDCVQGVVHIHWNINHIFLFFANDASRQSDLSGVASLTSELSCFLRLTKVASFEVVNRK